MLIKGKVISPLASFQMMLWTIVHEKNSNRSHLSSIRFL